MKCIEDVFFGGLDDDWDMFDILFECGHWKVGTKIEQLNGQGSCLFRIENDLTIHFCTFFNYCAYFRHQFFIFLRLNGLPMTQIIRYLNQALFEMNRTIVDLCILLNLEE